MADKITLLAGTARPVNTPFSTFSPLAVDFLDALSRTIRAEEKGEEIAPLASGAAAPMWRG